MRENFMTQTAKVAFITGGNRGIGLETARALGKLGITVVIGARTSKAGEEAAATLRKEGFATEVIEYDATRPDTDESVFAYFEKRFGRLDILVNNAGISREVLFGAQDTSTVPQTTLEETFETNFFAVVRLTQKLLPLIRKSDAGRIVNLSSILGSLGLHSAKDSPIGPAKAFGYNASKTALNAFTVHLADELRGTNIKVNSAHPGWVKTELGGPGAQMELPDGAKTSAFLATLPDDGPSGAFFHEKNQLPW
jgi:NAD(P)-dependent dehydrogenase (short-subunit alcohol dehydrogenase family)